jgi:UDP-N-acetylmuramoylalanine--D-glutamate ligase
MGGNIGISALDLEPLPEGGVYVIETSSYQLDLLDKTRFDVAVLLNITPDHLDRHGNMEGYIKAKKRIFRNNPAHAIVGIDEPHTRSIASSMKCLPISQNDILPLPELPFLPGAHNRQNIAAAFAACKALGLPDKAIIAGIESFKGLAHRMERVAKKNGIVFINDSKATNAEAAEKALLSFGAPIFWIAGGKAKDGGIEMLKPLFSKIIHTYLIGDAAEAFAKTLTANNAPFTHCGTLDKALAEAYKAAQNTNHATVLLSPACASFDQFKSFEQRGDMFRELVEKL